MHRYHMAEQQKLRKSRFDILDAWRTVAILLMLVYHFLYDLLIFGVITPAQMFSPELNLMQKFICGSFILLAGASARFSRSNLRHGIIVLLAGVAVEIGAAVGGQTIRFGILQFMGVSMVLWHFLGKYLQKLPRWLLAAGGAVLYVLTDWWTGQVTVSVPWLYPLGFPNAQFVSADYFPLLHWIFPFKSCTLQKDAFPMTRLDIMRPAMETSFPSNSAYCSLMSMLCAVTSYFVI